jgi:hypothetical protein
MGRIDLWPPRRSPARQRNASDDMPLNGARLDAVHRWTAARAHALSARGTRRKQKNLNAEGTLGRVGVPQQQSGVGPELSEAAACRCL